MRRKVGVVWVDMGPSSPPGCGPLGERHTKGHVSTPFDNSPSAMGTIIPDRGHLPMQFQPKVDIEGRYGD